MAAGAGRNVAVGYATHGDPLTESKQFAVAFKQFAGKRFVGKRHVPLFREEGRQIADLLLAQFDGDRLYDAARPFARSVGSQGMLQIGLLLSGQTRDMAIGRSITAMAAGADGQPLPG